MTRWMLIVAVAVSSTACGGGKHEPTSGPDHREPVPDPRPAIEVRRDAACEALGPRITDCSIADAKATMTAAELAKLDLEKTAPKHTEEFVAECKRQQLSSRQVRVYEVCVAEEHECEPLLACLDNVNPTAAERAAAGAGAAP